MKPYHIVILIVLIVILCLLSAVVIIGLKAGKLLFNKSMNRYYSGNRVSKGAKNADASHPLTAPNRDFRMEWWKDVQYENLVIESFDGLKLHGRLVINDPADKFAIICHGYTSYDAQMAFQAEKFFNKGFSVLLPTARGHGKSEGNFIGMGWYERLDIMKWIDLLNERFSNPSIILYGISMGGATVMNTIGEELTPNVVCAIEDCGFSSIKGQLIHAVGTMSGHPYKPVLFFGRPYIKRKTGIDINKDGNCLDQLAKSHTPMLFIHGDDDRYVPFSMLEENYNAHPDPKEKLVFPGVPHASCAWLGGDTYWNAVFSFVQKYCE